MMLDGRDYVKIREAARILGVTEQTLRNWDNRGKLSPVRHPINGYRMYRVSEIHDLVRAFAKEQPSFEFGETVYSDSSGIELSQGVEVISLCHWSADVALDPKHRPQHWKATSSTVRRDWRKFPQEAHVIDPTGRLYRRLSVDEIAVLQGFDPGIVRLDELTDRRRIAALGDAVPPPVSRAIVSSIDEAWNWSNRTALEFCAGIGGLAEGAASIDLDHVLLVDHSDDCGRLLRHDRAWHPDRVVVGDARSIDYSSFAGRIGLLSGGPPCQPWSNSGIGLGHDDARDLLGTIHEVVAQVTPEVFLFENVPGLAQGQNENYLRAIVERLRRPSSNLSYGVLVARLNAADFGVPQSRERIFILGFLNSPCSLAAKCFDMVESKQTHCKPGGGRRDLPRWVTVGEAISHMEDPGGWKLVIGAK